MLYQEQTVHRGKHGPKQHSRPIHTLLFILKGREYWCRNSNLRYFINFWLFLCSPLKPWLKSVGRERRKKWNQTISLVFQPPPPSNSRAKATTGEKELQLRKDLFFLAINLIPLFLCPTKHAKVLFHKVFSIRATKLPQSVAICFYHNCCSRSWESSRRERAPVLGCRTNEETE